MYKVIIIDDEPKIVEGLEKGLEWEKWKCQVVGTANDGEAGIKLIHELKPDILISDISMPRIDGLTMIAAIKSEFPNTQIMILTGFREFDYAQKAIELGVTRYLLKPSKFAELEEAIGIMTERLDALDIKAVQESEEEIEDSPATSYLVKRAMDYMTENYKEKIRLVDVAETLKVSQWHLSKVLNKTTGQTFSEIFNTIRVEKAKELLANPDMRVADVAEAVGFIDLAHFSRVFKKVSGMSANEYRNRTLG